MRPHDRVAGAIELRLPGANGAEAQGQGVVVAVIDTYPVHSQDDRQPAQAPNPPLGAYDPGGDIRGCFEAIAASGEPRFWRLAEANAGEVVIEVVDNYVAALPPGVHACPHHAYNDEIPRLANHGLFVADVVKDIAPQATVRVYRAFSDDGISDLQTIAQAADDAIKGANGAPLVINLSGGFGPQTSQVVRLLETIKDPGADYRLIAEQIAGAQPTPPEREIRELERAHLLQQNGRVYHFVNALQAIDTVFSQTGGVTRVLAVAAAGNDSYHHGGPVPFGPRLPAAVQNVLGVSAYVPDREAGRGSWRRASYSNDDDFFRGNDGIGAFGGETLKSGRSDEHDAPLGLFVSESDPDGAANESGWAYWSGTSFACPVVAGFAACLWSADTGRTAGGVRALVFGPPNAPDPEHLSLRQTPL